MIAKGTYVRGGGRKGSVAHLKAHFKYIEHRQRDQRDEPRDERRLFSKDHDAVDRKEAVEDVMEHTTTRVNYHKIVLSPAEDEPVQDWRQWTREVMADLEKAQRKELHWYAVHHNNTDHPHVHVVVAGAGYDWDTGKREAVILSRQDYERVRESGRFHSEHAWEHRLKELVQEVEQQDRERDDCVTHDQSNERWNNLTRGDIDR